MILFPCNRTTIVFASGMQMHLFDIDIPGKITFKVSDTLPPGNDVTVVKTGEPTSGFTGRQSRKMDRLCSHPWKRIKPTWRWSTARVSAAEGGTWRFWASFLI